MRNSVLALLMTVVSRSTTAELVQIITAETYDAYADLATIRGGAKPGKNVEVDRLQDSHNSPWRWAVPVFVIKVAGRI